jgi:hypothetical protein
MSRSPLAVLLTAVCFALLHCGGSGDAPAPTPRPKPLLAAPGDRLQITFVNTTRGPETTVPAYAVCTGLDAQGRFCHLDASGRFLPCSTTDNVIPRNGSTWCDYGIPIRDTPHLDLDPALAIISGRLYLSVGAPLYLRVDPASGGLVQPDPTNPADPNRSIRYDWVELTLDGTGFHGNTTCVDQFGLPIALTVTDRADPGNPLGPVGLTRARSALFQAYRASVPPEFQSLADPGDTRILAPAHGAFSAAGAYPDYLQGYIDAMWDKYRSEPLVLTPDEGTFTGRVDAQDRIVFNRNGDTYVIQGKPTTQEVFLCNGVLARGSGTEQVLGAQVAAMLNRHVLETPLAWRRAGGYYREDPCNRYARFWHQQSLGHRAYGFAYDDVNDQSASLATANPLEIILTCNWD